MPALALKEYQRESLDAIGRFCGAVRGAVGAKALRPVHEAYYAETGRDFIEVPQLPNVPYVCLRVPTGGGKTLIAAHAVGVIGKRLGHQDRPLCLWVTPSTTIRDQTLRGLRGLEHPYHAGLREGLGGAAGFGNRDSDNGTGRWVSRSPRRPRCRRPRPPTARQSRCAVKCVAKY